MEQASEVGRVGAPSVSTLAPEVIDWQQRHAPHPEVARKLFHVAAGLVSLTLPWLFHEAWPAVTLAVVTIAALVAVRRCAALRHRVGRLLHAVERESLGDLCFAVGVGLLFVLSRDRPLLYMVPVLVLTFADPAAALVGMRWGAHRYRVWGVAKSVEGSLAFFLVALASCALPLLVAGGAATAQRLAVVAVSAAGLTLVEAVCGYGLDNLFIPLAGMTLLRGLHAV